jgi:hypothetical protein
MSKCSTCNEVPPGTRKRASNYRVPKRSARRQVRGALVCLLLVLPYLTLCWLAPLQRVHASDVTEVVLTRYTFPCGTEYQLAFVSLSTTLEINKAAASSLGVVLIPKARGRNKAFNIYSFGEPVVIKRDDDQGQAGSNNYDKQKIENNFASFLKHASGCQSEPMVDALARSMATVLQNNSTHLKASEFAKLVEETGFNSFGNLSPVNEDFGPIGPIQDEADFSQEARQFSVTVKPEELKEVRRELEDWKTKAGKEQQRADNLQNQLDVLKQSIESKLWLYLAGLLALTAVSLVVYWNRQRIISLLSKIWAQTEPASPPIDPAKTPVAIELADLLDSWRERDQQVPPQSSYKQEAVGLFNEVREFNKKHKPDDKGALGWLINDSFNNLKRVEQSKKKKYKKVFHSLLYKLVAYQKKYYPLTTSVSIASSSGDAQTIPSESKSTEPETTETLPTTTDGNATPPITGAATVSLDDASLNLLVDRVGMRVQNVLTQLDNRHQQIEEMWRAWFGAEVSVPDDALEQIVSLNEDGSEVIKLVRKQFGNGELSLQDSKTKLKDLFEELDRLRNDYFSGSNGDLNGPDKILEKLKGKLGSDKEALAKTAETMRTLRKDDEGVLETAQRIAGEQQSILQLLQRFNSNSYNSAEKVVTDFRDQFDGLEERARNAKETVLSILPNAEGRIDTLVQSLADECRAAKELAGEAEQLKVERDEFRLRAEKAEPEAASAKSLAVEIAHQLNFNVDQLKSEEKPALVMQEWMGLELPLYRQLRNRLAAAASMFDEALSDASRTDVIHALRLESIRKDIAVFARSLQNLNPDELWARGISSGFNESWMHDLFRADMLLRHYFSGVDELYLLADAVAETCACFKSAMQRYGVQVMPVDLFDDPPPGVEQEKRALPSFTKLKEVRRKIDERYHPQQISGFVVDALKFCVKVNGVDKGGGCVVLMNPSDWKWVEE